MPRLAASTIYQLEKGGEVAASRGERVRLALILTLCLWLLVATSGNCQPCSVTAGLPSIRHYSLPLSLSSEAWAIAQASDGVLYFGIGDLIHEYDGTSWRFLRSRNGAVIRSLAAAPDGVIYVGGHAEIGRLMPGPLGDREYSSLHSQIPESERGFLSVWKTYVTAEGVYFQAKERLFRWSGERMRSWEPATSFHFSYVVNDHFYILDRGRGLLEMVDNQLLPIPGGEIFHGARIYAMLPISGGRILIGTRSRGLYLFDGTKVERHRTPLDERLQDAALYHGVTLADGTLALATIDTGIFVIDEDGQVRKHLCRRNGLPGDSVSYLFVDRSGVLWMAGRDGIARVEYPSAFSLFGEGLGVRGAGVLRFSAHDRVYMATSSGLYVSPAAEAAGCEFRRIGEIDGVTFSLALMGDRVLAATNSGIYEIVDDRVAQITQEISLRAHPSRYQPGVVYVGLNNGLSILRYRGEEWIQEGKVKGVDGQVSHIFEIDRDNLWVGTHASGVIHLQFSTPGREPRVTHSIDKGLPQGRVEISEFESRPVFMTDNGIYTFDEARQTFRPDVTFGDHLADSKRGVETLFEDDSGRAWIAHRGVGVEREDSDPAKLARVEVFNRAASATATLSAALKRLDGTGIFDITEDSEGALWIGTVSGFQRFDPDLKTRDPETSPVLAEVELTRQDGEKALLETNTRFLRSGDRIVRIETIGRDITERRKLEERLRRAQKLEAIGRLAGGVAHDFNNQLAAILGFSELLSADRPDDATLREYVDRIRRAGDQASRLTRQLLAVGRRQFLSPRCVQLNALLARIEVPLRDTLGQSILDLELDPDLAQIRVDSGQVEQVVLELAANARNAMPDGGHLRIATANTTVTRSWPDPGSPPPGDLVELTVSDSGVGMNEELRARIFEPFFTTKEFGQGPGLGLATVYGVMRQSGGYLRVESRAGAGTTFRLFFPIAEPLAEEVAKHAEPARPPAGPGGGPALALVVDDDPVVRNLACRVVEETQYRVIAASSAEEALGILEREAGICLLVTDVSMPGMSGLELAARVREHDPAIRIIVMSGYSEEVLEDRGAWEHKDAFVAKPFRLVEMQEVIRRVMCSS